MKPPAAPRVLCADDQPDVIEALRLLLKNHGFEVVTASSPAGVLAAVESQEPDAVLLDLNYARDTTSGREGLDLLARLRQEDPELPIVVMTAWGSVDGAVEAIRGGARDYVQKPWENARLVATLRTQVELRGALRRSRRLERQTSRSRDQGPVLVASSKAMEPVLRVLDRVRSSDANVLITGPHGSGKEVVANWLHAASPRAREAFVAVNGGGLADGVFESELFGHVRGAFTDAKTDRVGCFELAEGGTLFLDEIANMPTGQQVKLLRVLQTGEFHPVGSSRVRHADVRIVTATNADLGVEVAEQRFREDLLYRLNTVEIHLPPLRERREDVPELATLFLARQAKRYAKDVTGFAPDAMRALLEHPWPGNVRELEHAIERAILMCERDRICVEDLALRPRRGSSPPPIESMTLEEAEKHLIERALRSHPNVSDAAKALGLSRSALYRRLQHFGLRAP
jgi:DNA-binding NtrC family response regulator